MIVALPRTGTTLLEQMLDRHPDISGIGEYEGMQVIGNLATSSGLWPSALSSDDRARREGVAQDLSRRRGISASCIGEVDTRQESSLVALASADCGGDSIHCRDRDHKESKRLSHQHIPRQLPSEIVRVDWINGVDSARWQCASVDCSHGTRSTWSRT